MVCKLLKNNVYYILLKRYVQIYDELYTLKNPRGFRYRGLVNSYLVRLHVPRMANLSPCTAIRA